MTPTLELGHGAPLVVALVLALAAVGVGVSAPGRVTARRLQALDEPVPAPGVPRTGRRRPRGHRVVLPVVGLLVIPTIAGVLVGAAGLLLGIAASAVTGTVGLLLARRGRRRRAEAARRDVAQACALLAGQVRIGQVPASALRSAAEDCPVLGPAVDTLELGGDPVECWLAQSVRPGHLGLADLARAWRLAAVTGAALAPVLEAVSAGLEADRALGQVIATETSAPRATGKIMAVLPLVGIALGYVLGGDPVAFLLHSRAGWACLAAGSVCACSGVLWMEKIADRGARDP